MPPRKFDPTPIEQTTKSSRQQEAPNEDKPRPGRFVPEPIETTAKSSKDARQPQAEQNGRPKPRRFAPQVVEETHTSSKDKAAPEKKAHVKFKPEPVSSTYSSSRRARSDDESASPGGEGAEQKKAAPRKFAPILLDTAQRSRRSGDSNSVLSQSDKTEYGHSLHAREHRRHITGERTPSDVGSEDGENSSDCNRSPTLEHTSELRRQVSPMDGSAPPRPSCFAQTRQHSFRMPDLDTIESSESERESNSPSLSSSPDQGGSPITASDSSYEFYKHATRIRESVDENFTHYLLDLERKKAQQRLEEQALAAFPNPDFGYEPPHHYLNNDDDSDDMEIEDRPVTWEGHEDDLFQLKRKESTKMSPEQLEMQKHAEKARQERNANEKQASKSPWWNPGAALGIAEPDQELKSMRDRARPPMLGNDLVFPRCPSPEPARFDVTQGSSTLRKQMCYLSEAADYERKRSGEEGSLWQAPQPECKRVTVAKSTASPVKESPPKGLWGGFCTDDGDNVSPTGLLPPTGPTGLMTPKLESGNPLDQGFAAPRALGLKTPATPPASLKQFDLSRIDAVLVTEQELDVMMECEYPDSFITQVFNYLSLGYPSLARPFDDELAKISRFSMTDLRLDDQKAKASPRGYIRLGLDFEGGGGEGLTEDGCMRWQALKRYVREWARQEKNMVKMDGPGGNWGTGARRGSWAI